MVGITKKSEVETTKKSKLNKKLSSLFYRSLTLLQVTTMLALTM
jgi:hypothetical protein